MEWMVTLATAIAVLRLCLIFSGMFMLLRIFSQLGTKIDYQRKFFIFAGVIYLLGLLPQSLFLLINSDLVNSLLDKGYFCFSQNIACTVAAVLHSVIFLNWIIECIRLKYFESTNSIASLVKRKEVGYLLFLYAVAFIFVKNYFLRRDDIQRLYTDVLSNVDDAGESHWVLSPVEKPSRVVRLQLLLCESSISENQVQNFLIASYSFLILPLILCILWRPWMRSSHIRLKTSAGDESNAGELQPVQPLTCWGHEINIQRLLSTTITFWFHIIQPIIFCIYREHFVDFGTHFLLTISVFLPWPHLDYDPNQNWV